MCGIVGYIGKATAAPILLDGLRRLEYRGYDSAGLTTIDGGQLETRKCAGRIQSLADLLAKQPAPGRVGISHTRWATHGRPNDENAHPHYDQSGRLALVHNGVIENYQTLRAPLLEAGHRFRSQTDTEILAHLIGQIYDAAGGEHSKARLLEAARAALKQVIGTYGIALLHLDVPDVIIGARRGSPLAVGLGKGENFLVSDPQAIIAHTQEAIYLKDYDVALLERDAFEISTLEGGIAGSYEVTKVDFTSEDVKLGDYPHYMLKEIFEQPHAVRDALRGRLSVDDASARLGGLNMTPQELRDVDRIVLIACGTAYPRWVGRRISFRGAGAHPLRGGIRQRVPLPQHAVGQGHARPGHQPERRDHRHARRRAREPAQGPPHVEHLQQRGQHDCARVRRGRLHARRTGDWAWRPPNRSQARSRSSPCWRCCWGASATSRAARGCASSRNSTRFPNRSSACSNRATTSRKSPPRYAECKGLLFMGRQFNYPIALEGALKMKEITYIQSEGHPSAELKHGFIALVEPDMPSVFIAPDDAMFDSNVNSIEQVKARRGPVIAITTEGKKDLTKIADDIIYIPRCPDYLSPLLTVIPLQLLSYHMAVHLGRDVDKPAQPGQKCHGRINRRFFGTDQSCGITPSGARLPLVSLLGLRQTCPRGLRCLRPVAQRR